MNAIPVERAQDLAVAGKGTVKLELGKRMVTGVGTEFRKAFAQPKSSLAVKVPSGSGKHETCVVLDSLSVEYGGGGGTPNVEYGVSKRGVTCLMFCLLNAAIFWWFFVILQPCSSCCRSIERYKTYAVQAHFVHRRRDCRRCWQHCPRGR